MKFSAGQDYWWARVILRISGMAISTGYSTMAMISPLIPWIRFAGTLASAGNSVDEGFAQAVSAGYQNDIGHTAHGHCGDSAAFGFSTVSDRSVR